MEAALTSARAPLLRSAREAEASIATATLSAPDMMCGTCIRDVETALLGVRGVKMARANLGSRRVTAAYDPDRTSVEELVAALGKVGFKAAEIAEGAGP